METSLCQFIVVKVKKTILVKILRKVKTTDTQAQQWFSSKQNAYQNYLETERKVISSGRESRK